MRSINGPRSVLAMLLLAGSAISPAMGEKAAGPAPHSLAVDRSSNDVKTIAGSGLPGIVDGPAASASFLLPTAIARAEDGTLYVADEAAQRIRALRPDGTVATVAGSGEVAPDGLSVRGGYRDGPALFAQFNRPNGVAVGKDGAVYISDRRNACIRKLWRGEVATFAGKCGSPGTTDGAANTARIKDPRALVFDSAGTLYVADYAVGVRIIAPNGDVSTAKTTSTDDRRFWGVGLGGDPADPTLVASTPSAIVVFDLTSHRHSVIVTTAPAEGNRTFGNVNQVAGLDHRQFLFSDIRSNDIRYLRLPAKPFATTVFTRSIAGGAFDRQIDNAGYADGSLQSSRFFVPRGIVVFRGVAYVADSGNRRIRSVVLPRFRLPESGLADTTPYDDAHYQIVYIGASWAYWDSLGDDSICARLESELDGARRFSKPVRCHPVRIDAASFQQIDDYLANFLGRHVDLVVLSVNLAEAYSLFPNSSPPSIGAAIETFRQRVAALNERLAKNGAKLVLLWNEEAEDVSDEENDFEREASETRAFFPVDLSDNYTKGTRLMIEGVASLPLFQVDTYESFLQAERSSEGPLFGTDDSHMTPRGSALIAHLLARYLIGEKAL